MASPRVRPVVIIVTAIITAVSGLGPTAAVSGLGPTTAAAAPGSNGEPVVSVSIDTITPTEVTTTSPATVTVSGHIDNVSDHTVTNLAVRLQRATAVGSSRGLRTALQADSSEYGVVTDFQAVTGTLRRSANVPFTITAHLSGSPGLQINSLGIYPLLVNVNGTLDGDEQGDGLQTRLDDSRTLLPVLGLPPDPERAAEFAAAATGDDAVTAATADGSLVPTVAAPTPFTLLWPLAAPPLLAPGVPGGDGPARLANDDLARSLSRGGRLQSLLTAADNATAGPDAAGSRLNSSLCLAIDPDLLITVRDMADGYVVSTDPANPASPTRPGTGSAPAAAWLTQLRAVAKRLCVVALPYAQVSLGAVAQVGNASLARQAIARPADIVDDILDVRSVRGITIPATGVLSSPASATVLSALGGAARGAVIARNAAKVGIPDAVGIYRAAPMSVQLYDPAVTAALAQLGENPTIPAVIPSDDHVDVAGESAASRRESAIASMAYAAIVPSMPSKPDSGAVGRSSMIVPPAVWSASADDAAAVLSAAALLLDSGMASPRPLESVGSQLRSAATNPTARTATLSIPADAGIDATAIPGATITAVGELERQITLLQGSLVEPPDGGQPTPTTFTAPLRQDLLRTLRAAPQAADRNAVNAAAQMRTAGTAATIARLRGSVGVLDPGGQFTLASERSPLLLVVRNELPLPVRTRLVVGTPVGIAVDDVGTIEIPPRGTRQLQVPTRATSSRTVTVAISMVTTTGMPVGGSIELSVHSNAYGKPLFYVTIATAVLLVLLAGRRLWHRFRGRPDRADLDRPEPDERDRVMADSGYTHSNRRGATADADAGDLSDEREPR